jgi:hypothetical protein
VTFTAGQKLAAQDLDQLVSGTTQTIGSAANSHQAMTGSAADIAGTSLTFNTLYANTKVTIWAWFDVDSNSTTPANWGTFVGFAVVDGTSLQSQGEAHAAGVRDTCSQGWIITLVAAGSHTIKLQGLKTGGTDTVSTNATHTKWHALVEGP